MGDLPAPRCSPSRPFAATGVDFCGPFYIKYKGQRTKSEHKAYVAIFVCLATKAIHMELVTELTTQAFVATLKRFFARRGKCTTLYSDNATNFVGANAELKRLHTLATKLHTDLAPFTSLQPITWKFIPPRAPNFGGLWEAGVKSFKHHYQRIVGKTILTYEDFLTITNQIEGILNSRPISPMSQDPNDLEPLTPGHFLTGGPINTVLQPDSTTIAENRLNRWQRNSQIVQQFWKKWHLDYLNTLQQRTKWQIRQNNLQPGALVVIKNDLLPPLQWALGRVTSVVTGRDGRVRVAILKTATGELRRPISKLGLLPTEG